MKDMFYITAIVWFIFTYLCLLNIALDVDNIADNIHELNLTLIRK